MDLNDEKQLEKLREAVASDNGQLIIQYLQEESGKLGFDKIKVDDRNFEEIGMDFKMSLKINEYLNGVFSFFDNMLKD